MTMTPSHPLTAADALIHALLRNDLDTARNLLAPDITFRALLPRRVAEPAGREAVLELLACWFPAGAVDELEALVSGTVVDRHHVGYRVRWHNPAGERFVFEQHAFYDAGDTGITWMHLVCTGHRALPTLSS
jgi:SnoaL-like domain